MVLVWVLLPTVVIGLIGMLLMSGRERPPGCRAVLRRLAGRALRPFRRASRTSPPAATAPDPFHVLALQIRLGFLADQVRTLENDPAVWARGRRLMATRAAYDALLAEACGLAGVDMDAAVWPSAEDLGPPGDLHADAGLDAVVGPPSPRPAPDSGDPALLASLLHEEPDLQRQELRRFRGEMELASRGWSW